MPSDTLLMPYIAVKIAVAAFSFIPASVLNNKWTNRNPTKLGFFWGYWFLSFVYAGYAVFFGTMLVFGAEEFFTNGIRLDQFVAFILIPILLGVVGYYAFKRHRWALVASTIMSFSAYVIVINLTYLRNRWKEFKLEASDRAGVTGRDQDTDAGIAIKLTQRTGIKVNKTMRLALFGGLVWSCGVMLNGLLSDTYGSHVSADEFMEMLQISIWPSIVTACLAYVYTRFVQ